MSAPAPSKLDAGQVLQGSFDESTGRLRTDATATVVNADIDVSLDPSEDGVFIADKDSGNKLKVESDGSINVNSEEIKNILVSIDATLESIDTGISQPQKTGLLYEQASSTVMYVAEGLYGALPSESKWYIKKIDTSSGVKITLASEGFDQIWNNRASLVYV